MEPEAHTPEQATPAVFDVAGQLAQMLGSIHIAARLIALDTGDVLATLPMVRGVWGAALHGVDPAAYKNVFEEDPAAKTPPKYILRPAMADPIYMPALEWISIGTAIDHDHSLLRAWDVASGMGLGPQRKRFRIKAVFPLDPAGQPMENSLALRPWPVSRAQWPLPGDPTRTPCCVVFGAPLRLMRQGRLITEPTLADIAVAILRRIGQFAAPAQDDVHKALQTILINAANQVPARPWQGSRLDLVRYSGRQKSVVDMHGVAGSIDLPQGPGPLWPLLAAAQWLHIGKGAVVGLGQLIIEPCHP